ncbi:synergin gamma-like isoform 1-T3 [Liasis olivaceus]
MKSLQASVTHLSVERCCFLHPEQPTFGVHQIRLSFLRSPEGNGCSFQLLGIMPITCKWLSEIYQISRRLGEAMNARKLASELVLQTLHEVDLAWNNLLSFLVFGRSAFQALLRLPAAVSEPCLALPNDGANHVCAVCLTVVKQEPQVHLGNLDPIVCQGFFYHISCANFWLNCVDSTLPRET